MMLRRMPFAMAWSFWISISFGAPLLAQPIRNAPVPGIVDPAPTRQIETPDVVDGEDPVVPPERGVTPARTRPTAVENIPRGTVTVDRTPDVLPTPTLNPEFGIPEGLRIAPDVLLARLGYGSAASFPLTTRLCFEVGCKCYARGMFVDALAFTNHGLKLSNHARLYLLKALCELNLNLPGDATETLIKYRIAAVRPQESIGLREAREQLNGPSLVRISMLMDAWSRNP